MTLLIGAQTTDCNIEAEDQTCTRCFMITMSYNTTSSNGLVAIGLWGCCSADKLHNFVSSHSNIVKHCQTWPTCLSEGEDEVIAAE